MRGHSKTFEKACSVGMVSSFDELMAASFEGQINALCWPRQLQGDFQEIIDQLKTDDEITTITDHDLFALRLSPGGRRARDELLADLALLRGHGLTPSLDCIASYPRDDAGGPIPTDVYSFHVDSAPVQADTYLCTYIGRTSEGLSNELAMRRVEHAETRAQLLKIYGGPDDEKFAAYLSEHSFDLHYLPLPGAKPYTFGLANLWRIAVAYPDCPVLPCIHRAPPTPPGVPARLLLIS